jgi:hypothetical protein
MDFRQLSTHCGHLYILIEYLTIRKEIMESLDILILGVEAAIALAGFAGIIATFQFSGAKETRRGDAVGLAMILQFSLLAALGCAIPLLLYTFGVKETSLWAISSALAIILLAGGTYVQYAKARGVNMSPSMLRMFVILVSPSFILIIINVMNAADMIFHREAGPVIAAIVWSLCLAGYMFSRLLLRPIWRNVRLQEAAKLADAASG